MSTTVDSKVVQLSFDNKNFESNAQTSISTLDKLKASLNFKDLSHGISDVASENGLGMLGSAANTVKDKFSAMEVVAITALANITNSAVNAGKQLIKSLSVDNIKAGFQEYELKLNSVQTIMNSTGAPIEEVTKYLNELNDYADRTIYSFSDMTSNIGKFTNAGVKLKDAVGAIKGISNAAALAGSSSEQASHAMYNFAQALGSGFVSLLDWKSIEIAGINTVEFNRHLLETAIACGTVEKAADGMYKVLTTNGSGAYMEDLINETSHWRDSLQYQWITTEVLTKALNDYASETTDVGKRANKAATEVKSFTQLMDTLKESIGSGWAESFELIIGDFEEAKVLWTAVSDVLEKSIGKIGKARNEMLTTWDQMDGRKKLISALSNAFEQLAKVAKAIKEAFTDIFPPKTDRDLWNFIRGYDALSKSFKISKPTLKDIKTIFKGIFSVIHILLSPLSALLRLVVNLTKMLVPFVPPLLHIAAAFAKIAIKLNDVITKANIFNRIADKIIEGLKAINDLFEMIFNVSVVEVMYAFGDFLADVPKRLNELVEVLTGASIVEILKAVYEMLKNIPSEAHKAYKAFTGMSLAETFEKIAEKIKAAGEAIKDFVKNSEKLNNLPNTLKGVASNAEKAAKSIGKSAESMGSKLKDATKSAMTKVTKSDKLPIAEILEKSASSVEVSTDSIKENIEGMKDTDTSGVEQVSKNVQNTLSPLEKLLNGLKKLIEPIKPLLDGIKDIFNGLGASLGKTTKEALADYDFDTLLSVFFNGILISIGLKLRKAAKFLSGEAIEDIRIVLNTVKESLESWQKTLKAKRLLYLAGAVLMIAGAIFVLSKVPVEQLIPATVAIGAVFLMLITTFNKVSKFDPDSVKSVTGAMIAMGAAVWLISFAITNIAKALDKMEDPKNMVFAIGAVMLLIGELGFVMIQMSNNTKDLPKGIAGVMALAAAVQMLSLAIVPLGLMKFEDVAQGVLAITILLLELFTFVKLAPEHTKMLAIGIGLMGVAAAIDIITLSVITLGLMPWEKAKQGILAIGGILLALGIFVKLAGSPRRFIETAAGLLIMAGAVDIIAIAISKLGKEKGPDIAAGVIAIGAVVAMLMFAGNSLKGAVLGAASFALMASGIMILAVAIKTLGEMKLLDAIQGLGILAGILIIVGVGAGLLSGVAPVLVAIGEAFALAGLGMLAFGAGCYLVVEAITKLATADLEGLQSKLQEVITTLVTLTPSFVNLIATFIDALGENADKIVNGLLKILYAIVDGLLTYLPKILTRLVKPFADLFYALGLLFEDWWDKNGKSISDWFKKTGKAIKDKGKEIVNAVKYVLKAALDGIKDTIDKFKKKGTEIVTKIQNGITSSAKAVKNAIKDLIKAAIKVITDKVKDFKDAGKNIAKGLKEGITGAIDDVKEGAKNLATSAYDTVTGWFEIKSPSRKFMKIGRYVAEGLALGITKYADKVEDASLAMSKTALDSVKETLNHMDTNVSDAMDFQPTITPVLDLSRVKTGANAIDNLLNGQNSIDLASKLNVTNTNDYNTRTLTDSLSKEFKSLRGDVADLAESITRMKIVMDRGTVVGELIGDIDVALGNRAILAGRSV